MWLHDTPPDPLTPVPIEPPAGPPEPVTPDGDPIRPISDPLPQEVPDPVREPPSRQPPMSAGLRSMHWRALR